jgi:hypothetical protein
VVAVVLSDKVNAVIVLAVTAGRPDGLDDLEIQRFEQRYIGRRMAGFCPPRMDIPDITAVRALASMCSC